MSSIMDAENEEDSGCILIDSSDDEQELASSSELEDPEPSVGVAPQACAYRIVDAEAIVRLQVRIPVLA
jgi:hypothetical protein